ncbi:MAG TPA: substrate-binding domain-containing protein [Anaerolineae bacterium]|nr:substrate-binding domain-containing protein [Anaerolineae bacterium]
MRTIDRRPPTLGFLSTWSVYEGTTIDNYTRTLLQGICAAARDRNCNLLLGCGIGLPATPRGNRTAWATPGATVDFVPVGPWNTDGLIIIPDDFTDDQFKYTEDLIHAGFPVVLTTSEEPGPTVAVDNAGGIYKAFTHLVQHGHQRIAFIAGKSGRGGDSAERLAAYREAVHSFGLVEDERLIAFGEHRREDGRKAMQQILATSAPFTAVLASNDLSALGAVEVLRAAGRHVPEDVAIIGFDDILDARSHLPPLTTVRHPTFALGYEAVLSLLATLEGQRTEEVHTRVPTRLVIRQSCGCRPKDTTIAPVAHPLVNKSAVDQASLAHVMAEAVLVEAEHSALAEIERLCSMLLQAFSVSLTHNDPRPFDGALQQLVNWLDAQSEDANAWHAAFSALRTVLIELLATIPSATPEFADALIDRARLEIVEQVQRQATDALLRHMDMSNRLGLMTSQLLTMLDATASANVLAYHLPQLGLQHVLVAAYTPRDDDPAAQATVLLDAGLSSGHVDQHFLSREFPPPGFYPAEVPFQLAVLPLIIDEHTTGFVAFSATNLDPCAAIVHNLAAALRMSHLYHEAVEGRQLAEEANRLKSRFLSMVSHELRTPLSLIIGLSEMVVSEQREKPELSSAAMRDIQQINASAQHLARLIGDVLDLASSEAGQLRILREPLDLAEVLHVAAGIGKQLAQDKGLIWRADLPAQGPWILGDRTRVQQVALNLISNAVKFTAAGAVTLSVKVEGQQATIAVSDTGLGILPAEQALLFREFQRVERVVQSGYSGLGLGLAISKQLVEQHGGTIGVRSPGELGTGSTFFFTLPIIATTALQPDHALPAIARGNRVIVLADRAEAADRLYPFLHELGYDVQIWRVDETTDWPAQLSAAAPLAVVLDNELAAREGWLIINLLKRQPATERLPVLVYALDAAHDQGELLELNYLHKPLRTAQLAQELARYGEMSDANAEQRTVLVVDDDPNILDLHCRLVERSGCRALRARHGREALDVIEHTQPDLILLDLMMPEMDGFAVLEALRSNERTRNIPVIVLTARVLSDADVERCNRGVAAILSKGLFDTSETLKHIETALARQRTLGSATQRLVRRAMAFIQAHYAEALSREEIAGHIGISADYLTDCFRQEMGITPVTYLNRYRLLKARELLENTDLKITEIALAVGFSESAHFTRTFQREVGVSPRAYRRSKQG